MRVLVRLFLFVVCLAPTFTDAWDLGGPCREALIRFQGKPAKALVDSARVLTDIDEMIGADTGLVYRPNWKVNVQPEAPVIEFKFEGQSPAQISLAFEYPNESRYVLRTRLPRGEAHALQDLNLLTVALRHISERAASGDKIEWEINDPNLVDLLNDRLQKIAQMPQLDLPGDVRRGLGSVEDEPLFYNSVVWDSSTDAFFALVSVEDGLAAVERVNSDPEAQKFLIEALRASPIGEAFLATGPWIVDLKLVPAMDHLRSLSARGGEVGDESKLLFPFRYKLVLESI